MPTDREKIECMQRTIDLQNKHIEQLIRRKCELENTMCVINTERDTLIRECRQLRQNLEMAKW